MSPWGRITRLPSATVRTSNAMSGIGLPSRHRAFPGRPDYARRRRTSIDPADESGQELAPLQGSSADPEVAQKAVEALAVLQIEGRRAEHERTADGGDAAGMLPRVPDDRRAVHPHHRAAAVVHHGDVRPPA